MQLLNSVQYIYIVIMSIAERKEREKNEMKQLILSAATKMFLEEGYAKTSIRNIADAIDYSPGTIYLYYKDKDELLYEVQQRAYGTLLVFFKEKANSTDPLERLAQIAKSYIEFGLANPELYDLMFIIRSPMNVDEALHKANGGESLYYLTSCLQQCMEKKLVRFTDLELATLETWSVAHGLVSLNLRCRLKVMFPESDAVPRMLERAIQDYIDLIKT